MDEFLTGYYGVAAAPIKKYIRLLTDHVARVNYHLGLFDDPTWYLPEGLIDQADMLWDEAESLAANDEELARIRRSRLQVRYARVQRMTNEDPARAALVESLIDDIKAFGIGMIREACPLEKSIEVLRAGGPYK